MTRFSPKVGDLRNGHDGPLATPGRSQASTRCMSEVKRRHIRVELGVNDSGIGRVGPRLAKRASVGDP